MKHKFHIYAHAEHDEEAREEAEEIASGSVDADSIEEFLGTNPLYEIEFDIEYDTETGKFEFLACRSTNEGIWGDWELVRK